MCILVKWCNLTYLWLPSSKCSLYQLLGRWAPCLKQEFAADYVKAKDTGYHSVWMCDKLSSLSAWLPTSELNSSLSPAIKLEIPNEVAGYRILLKLCIAQGVHPFGERRLDKLYCRWDQRHSRHGNDEHFPGWENGASQEAGSTFQDLGGRNWYAASRGPSHLGERHLGPWWYWWNEGQKSDLWVDRRTNLESTALLLLLYPWQASDFILWPWLEESPLASSCEDHQCRCHSFGLKFA